MYSKKNRSQNEESVDVVITFKELYKWIKEEKIELNQLKDTEFDGISKEDRLFPIVGYVTDRIKENNPRRKIFYVNGIEECKKTIEAIKNNKFKNILYEMTACRYGCISGTGMPLDNGCYHERRENLLEYANGVHLNNREKEQVNDLKEYKLDRINVDKTFKDLHKPLAIPSEKDTKKILNSMGKYRKSDEINCRNCGYSTCREKALAVYNNMAQKVINNQMTVAQEIASLLGETTAETKATLTKLKNLIEEEGVK